MLASAHSSGLDTAMSCVKEETRGFIKLAGTVTTVLEFFQFAINNILYQRAFTTVKKYNLHLLIATDNAIKAYLDQIMHQLQCWISAKTISKLVMVISTKSTGEILERWQFDVNLHQHCISNQKPVSETTLTTEKQTNAEIAAIMRQITASVSFLPILDDPCTFNILVYTDKNALVPPTWVDSDPKLISHNAEQVKLRSFSTAMHKIDGLVAYKLTE